MRAVLEEAGVVDEPSRDELAALHCGDRMPSRDGTHGTVGPTALRHEVRQAIVGTLRFTGVAPRAGSDRFNALPFSVAQEPGTIGRQRLARLASREMVTDSLEVSRKPADSPGVHRELHACTLHAADLDGKSRFAEPRRWTPQSGKQTTLDSGRATTAAVEPAVVLAAFVRGWLWSPMWPPVGFYDSRNLGVGFVFWVAILVAVPCLRSLQRRSWPLIGMLARLSLLSRDFCHPRWASTLLVAVILIVGVGMAELSVSRLGRFAFLPLLLVLFAHRLRPELELSMLSATGIGPRLNVMASPFFIHGPGAIDAWPDLRALLIIVQEKGVVLPVYGTHLSNTVLETIPGAKVDKYCAKLIEMGTEERDVLVVDDFEFTKACNRECQLHDGPYCLAYRIKTRPPDANFVP